MKTIIKQLKLISLFLSMLIFFQSCVTYKKTTRSLDEIVELKTRVRLVTFDKQVYRFKKIEKRNNNYYGIKFSKNTSKDLVIFINDIKTLKVYDGVTSTILTVFVSLLLIASIVVGVSGVAGFYGGINTFY